MTQLGDKLVALYSTIWDHALYVLIPTLMYGVTILCVIDLDHLHSPWKNTGIKLRVPTSLTNCP